MRWAFTFFLVLHGAIHLMGPAKAFGWAELAALSQPITRGMGVVWGLAGGLFLLSALLFHTAPRGWWLLAVPALLLSQVGIVSSWSDAWVGTAANLVVLAVALWAAGAHGPWSLRAAYSEDIRAEEARRAAGGGHGIELRVPSSRAAERSHDSAPTPLSEVHLASLPGPVAGYLRALDLVGEPIPTHLILRWDGQIRGGPGEAWMTFTAEQHNFFDRPSRYFLMDARRGGLPVDVYHRYVEGRASMRVRFLSLLPLVDARGPEMDRAETVTLFNDLVLFAPAALVHASVRWDEIDERSIRGHYTVGEQTVSALLIFGDDGFLTDFVSDDRFAASPDGRTFTPMRWSTPVPGWTRVDGRLVPEGAEGMWHGDEPYAYFEGSITSVELRP